MYRMLPFFKPPPHFFLPNTDPMPTPPPLVPPTPMLNADIAQPIGRFGIYRPPLVPPTPPLEVSMLNSLERAKKRIIPEPVNKNIFV